tara:strand:- start:1089 stop:2150 length:1062 start_codon:yes stop_codon:yes gene_type:complete
MGTINSQTDGGAALSTDEFVINRAGTDYKLSHANIVAGVTTLITTEEAARIAADTTLDNNKVDRAGDTMSGLLTLSGAPSSALHATTKLYVDTADALKLNLSGGTLTGPLVLSGDPTLPLHPVTLQYLTGTTGVGGRWKNAVSLDCSSNPNYPASDQGDTIRVTIGGKIGGVSGKDVEPGDFIYCHTTDINGGVESAVGFNYSVIQGDLKPATQTSSGHIQIATDAEIDGGTDDAKVITPRGARRIVERLVEGYNKVTDGTTSITIPTSAQSTIYFLTSSSARSISLPVISAMTGDTNITINIKDASFSASTGNITVSAGAGNVIEGSSTFIMDQNGQSITIINDGSTNWYII